MEEKNYKVAFFSLLGFVIGGLVVGILVYNITNNNSNTKESEKSNKNTSEKIKINEKKEYKEKDKSTVASNIVKQQESINKELSKEDNVVINYLQEKYEDLSSKVTKENAKALFIEIVDFLFYDGEIKGYTLSDLTNRGKLEVISLCTKIEMKIEEKHPGAIDETESKYKDKKEKLISKYNEHIDKYCNNNSEVCESFKTTFEDIKKTFGKTFDKVKEYGSKGKEKLNNWYSNFKNN